jgi:hypothetical protein
MARFYRLIAVEYGITAGVAARGDADPEAVELAVEFRYFKIGI